MTYTSVKNNQFDKAETTHAYSDQRAATLDSEVGIWNVIAMLGLVATMQLGSYFVVDSGWLLLSVLSAVLAWFVYAHVSEFNLFVRGMLSNASHKGLRWSHLPVSMLHINKIVIFTLAFFCSGSFLLYAQQMPWYVWAIAYADVILLMGLLHLSHQSEGDIEKPKTFGVLNYAAVFWMNIGILTAFFCAYYAFIPMTDTSDMSLLQAGQMAWAQTWQSTADPFIGYWGGLLAVMGAVMENLTQQLSHLDNPPFNIVFTVCNWGLIITAQAVSIWIIQSAMFGAWRFSRKITG